MSSRVQLLRFASAVERNPAIDAWFERRAGELGTLARPWYKRMRQCGHPNWWGQPPAILKGWIDRVFRPGVAYDYPPGVGQEGRPVGLLGARAALIFNASNTPPDREMSQFGDPLETLWRRCVFALCGVLDVERRVFGPMASSTPALRERWLADVREMVARHA